MIDGVNRSETSGRPPGRTPQDPFGLDDVDIDALRARRTIKWSKFGPDVLAAWVAEMDFPTAPAIVTAIDDAVRREQFGYSLPEVETGLPGAFADWSKDRHGWSVDPERVHLVPDLLVGVMVAIEFFSRPGSPVILPTPAYMPFFDLPGAVGRDIIEVPLARDGDGRYSLDLDGIDAAFAAGAGSIIHCHPHNPVGRVFSRQELEALARVVDRHGGRVISDEIHAPLTYGGVAHIPYASISDMAAGHTLTLTAASKAWNLPGLKCAMAVTSNDRDDQTWRANALHAHGASPLGAVASVAAFRDGRSWLDAVVGYLDETRTWLADLLGERLPQVRYTPPEATYLAWLDCRALDLPTEPGEWFLDHAKVALNQGPTFGDPGRGHVRLNLATSRSILERIVTAMADSVPR